MSVVGLTERQDLLLWEQIQLYRQQLPAQQLPGQLTRFPPQGWACESIPRERTATIPRTRALRSRTTPDFAPTLS